MKLAVSVSLPAVGIILLAALLHNVAGAHNMDLGKALHERSLSAPGRELKASSLRDSLVKRHTEFRLTNEVALNYAEGENFESESNFAACIHAKSSTPVLLLEDYEHLADYIECRPGEIYLHLFPGLEHSSSKTTLLKLKGGTIITSHYSCNEQGERAVFRVWDVQISADGASIILYSEQVSWKQAFSSIKVSLDHNSEGHIYRPHSDLRRRQSALASSSVVSLPDQTLTVPTATSTATVNTLDANHALVDQDLLPANSSLQITCTKCSTYGSLDFSFLNFDFDPDLDRTLEGGFILGDIFTGGEATVVANGLGAHVELYLNISRSDDFSIPLFELPLLFAIKLSNIGLVGLSYAPELHVAYDLNNGSLGFGYGFELSVPDQSRLFVDLTDPTNSTVTGFGDSSVSPLPFQANVDVDAVQLGVALRHRVKIGFNFDDAGVGANVGVYLDLPGLEANVTHLADVDESCASLAGSQSEDRDVAQRVLTDVYEIAPSVLWGVGFNGQAHVEVFKKAFDIPIVNGTIADIPTACLNFDAEASSYVPASEVVAKAKKGGAGQLRIPGVEYWVALVGGVFVLLL